MSEFDDAHRYLLARWILPISDAPVENGCLVISDKRIVGIISRADYEKLPGPAKRQNSIEYGEAAIVPGLVNLHTHLDYSALKHFDNYSNFFLWIRKLIGNSWQWSQEQWLDSALVGAREVISSATSTLADSSPSGASARAIALSGLRGVVGLELFGIDEEQEEKTFEIWLQKYQGFMDSASKEPSLKKALEDDRLQITIAPHTPYSVCPSLIRRSLAWCKEKGLPLFIHIAESEAECRWIASGEPQLDDFLKEAFRGELPSTPWRGHGLSPVQHMEKFGLLDHQVLAAHVVQMDDDDIELLARHKVSAAHCPRSNSRLRNGIAPLMKMITAGIELGFGTDSAASTDDLNVLSEARFAWDLHRAANKEFSESAERALYYLTLGAARALKVDTKTGSLSEGKYADFSVFSLADLPEIAQANPFECLVYGGAQAKDLVVNGVWLMRDGYIADTPKIGATERQIGADFTADKLGSKI
ncbi:MAG: amidohydrolase family protein [Candidatus Obscuribacterales bacterium]|jgi:5-methylthioadenosine/S-adenosylhomocysteine deaminase|nr:amidohydrolase family protein [Candidatus Obscuribacterales bacterium]